MYVLNIWHTVSDYGEWKKVFDSDPLEREASGVRRYVLEHPVGNENMVIGHLEFDSLGEAEAFAGRLEETWRGVASEMVSDPGYTISEVVERGEYGGQSVRWAA
ncbi:MAG: hypothetical protein GX624_05370 [Actinobacteria bacterium]|nr:hypothetical protein [Actinomycetota bacterium]